MTRKPKGPVKDAPPLLRQRLRADGTWRVWWEPDAILKSLGFAVVELDGGFPVKAARLARDLNAKAAIARAGGAKPHRGARSVDDAITDYFASVRFERLRPATQKTYREKLALVARKWGDVAVRDMDKPTMNTWYETLCRASGLRQAQALLAVMSIIMGHAERRGWRDANSNPCLRLGMQTPVPRARVAGFDQLDALMTAAVACGLPSVGLAAALSMLAGQRQSDVLAARRGDFIQVQVQLPGMDAAAPVWAWDILRAKRKTAGQIMLHPELVALITAVLARPAPGDAHLIVEERVGRAYDKDLFAKRWAEVRAGAIAAGATGLLGPDGTPLQFRDLRRTFSVTTRANGASKDDAGDVLGNSAAMTPQLGQTYMPAQFLTAARAVALMTRPATAGDDERKKA